MFARLMMCGLLPLVPAGWVWAPCGGSKMPAAAVIVFFSAPEASWSRLFPSGGVVRVARGEPGAAPSAADAQHLLASLSSFPEKSFQWHGQFDDFSAYSMPTSLLDPNGSGLAFLPRPVDGGTRVALCPLYRNAIVGQVQAVGANESDFILLKVLLGSQPYVCVMCVFTPRTDDEMSAVMDRIHAGEGRFEGTAGQVVPIKIDKASPEVQDALCGAR